MQRVLKYVHGAFAKPKTFEDKLHSQEGNLREKILIHTNYSREASALSSFPALLFPLIEVQTRNGDWSGQLAAGLNDLLKILISQFN